MTATVADDHGTAHRRTCKLSTAVSALAEKTY